MRTLIMAALLLGLLSSTTGWAADEEKRLLLEVVINGRPTGEIADFIQRDAKLYAKRHDLRDLGFAAAKEKDGPDDELLSIDSFPDISYRIDGPTQTLQVTAKDAALIATALEAQEAVASTPIESGFGSVLNYEFTDTYSGGKSVAQGLLDGRVFSPYGIVETQQILAFGDRGASDSVRLDTSGSYSDPDSLRRYNLGDFINGGLSWTRPIRLGGAQVNTNFGIRPDLITFPVPQISGSAAVPSTVDVLVNNVRQFSRNVDPGPFAVTQLPVVNGAGTVSVLVQDALGHQTLQTLPFYTTNTLLTPGLASYTAELGKLRRNYGTVSDDYSTSVASGSVRYGLFRFLTLEGHGEATTVLKSGGVGAAINLHDLAVISFAGALSKYTGQAGTLWSASIERVTSRLSLAASIQTTSHGYRDVAAISGDPVPRRLIRASAGIPLGRFGSLSIAYTALVQAPPEATQTNPLLDTFNNGFEPTVAPLAPSLSAETELLSITHSALLFGNVYGYTTGFHNFIKGGSSGILVGVSMSLGPRYSGAASTGYSDHQISSTVQASRAAVVPGDFGGTVLVQRGLPNRQFAQGEYIAPFAHFTAGADQSNGSTTLRGDVTGSIAAANGDLFASNSIVDSFAVVDTAGLPNIEVLQENRPVGRTDQSGQLLLPHLQSFANNRIGINTADVPIDTDLASASRLIRPQDRSGVVVKFPLRSNASAVVHIVDPAGRYLPVGSAVVLEPGSVKNVVGYDGVAYLRGLGEHNVIVVTDLAGKRCKAEFKFKLKPGKIPDLGRLLCRSL